MVPLGKLNTEDCIITHGSLASDIIMGGISYSDVDRWIETAKKCQYLPENDLKVSAYT